MKTFSFLFVLLLQTNLFFSQNENEFVISQEIYNTLYVGLDNPIEIAVFNSKPEEISIETSAGTIKKNGITTYIVHPESIGSLTLSVFKNKKAIGNKIFMCKATPDPMVFVTNQMREGSISRAVLLAQTGIMAKLVDFMLEVPYSIKGFSLTVITDDTPTTEISTSDMFTPEQKKLIQDAPIGSKVVIDKVNCIGPEGLLRNVEPISLIIK